MTDDLHAAANVRFIAVSDAAALRLEALQRILDAAADAIAQRGRFLLVLAGGGTPREIYRSLSRAHGDWSRWQIYFGDERCLDAGHPDRNSTMAGAVWLDQILIPRGNIHPIPADLGPIDGARAYQATLSTVEDFDLVLLGLGEDGHTASLFPGQDWGVASDSPAALPVLAAPKPPPERISLSAARLNQTRAALFLIEGEGKRQAVTRWRAGASIPAVAIQPENGIDALVVAELLIPESPPRRPYVE